MRTVSTRRRRGSARWVAEGKIRWHEDVTEGLENAPRAFIGMLRRREPRQGARQGLGRPGPVPTGQCGVRPRTWLRRWIVGSDRRLPCSPDGFGGDSGSRGTQVGASGSRPGCTGHASSGLGRFAPPAGSPRDALPAATARNLRRGPRSRAALAGDHRRVGERRADGVDRGSRARRSCGATERTKPTTAVLRERVDRVALHRRSGRPGTRSRRSRLRLHRLRQRAAPRRRRRRRSPPSDPPVLLVGQRRRSSASPVATPALRQAKSTAPTGCHAARIARRRTRRRDRAPGPRCPPARARSTIAAPIPAPARDKSRLRNKDDLAHVLPRLDQRVRLRRFAQRERRADDRLDRARAPQREQLGDRLAARRRADAASAGRDRSRRG